MGAAVALRARIAPLIPALRTAGFAAAVAIVIYIGIRAFGEVRLSDLEWWPLPFAVLGAGAWWLLLGRAWGLIASGRSSRRDVSVWCRTQALRFIPGGLWAPASRASVVRGGSLDKLSAVIGENLAVLSAALVVGGAALALAGRLPWLALVLAAGVPWLSARLLAGRIHVTPERMLRAFGNDVVAFLAYGVAAVLVQLAVSGWREPLAVAGAAAVAWAAGLVVVFAPSGVGVREVVYVGLLAGSLPSGEAAAGAVTMRLAMIVAELAVLVIAGRPGAAPPQEGSATGTAPA
jgi:uncharacterized membrane protein YbhN (UPF0104 family)